MRRDRKRIKGRSLRHLGTRFHRKVADSRATLKRPVAQRERERDTLRRGLDAVPKWTIWNSLYQQTNEQLVPIGSVGAWALFLSLFLVMLCYIAQLALPRFPSSSCSPLSLSLLRPLFRHDCRAPAYFSSGSSPRKICRSTGTPVPARSFRRARGSRFTLFAGVTLRARAAFLLS